MNQLLQQSKTPRQKAMKADTESLEPSQDRPRRAGFFQKLSHRERVAVIGIVSLLIVALAVAAYSLRELYLVRSPAYQQKLIERQTAKVVSEVGSKIVLPAGTPQMATVSDAEALKKNQPFFQDSMNGDQVLVYPNEAILYRPSIHKIVTVAPVAADTAPTTSPSVSASSSAPAPAATPAATTKK